MIEKPYSIFAETNDYLVVIKNASVPSSKGLTPNSVSELVEKDFPEIALVQGKKQNDGGLVHRLDTETSGLMLFAKNQGFYDFIMEAQSKNQFEKTYTAYCAIKSSDWKKIENFGSKSIQSFFRSFGEKGAMVKPVFDLENETRANKKKCGKKLYETKIESVEKFLVKTFNQEEIILLKIKCKITQGFRHQVRSHLASQNLPVFGDKVYNPVFSNASKMLFFASGMDFLDKSYKISESVLDEIAKTTFLASAIR